MRACHIPYWNTALLEKSDRRSAHGIHTHTQSKCINNVFNIKNSTSLHSHPNQRHRRLFFLPRPFILLDFIRCYHIDVYWTKLAPYVQISLHQLYYPRSSKFGDKKSYARSTTQSSLHLIPRAHPSYPLLHLSFD